MTAQVQEHLHHIELSTAWDSYLATHVQLYTSCCPLSLDDCTPEPSGRVLTSTSETSGWSSWVVNGDKFMYPTTASRVREIVTINQFAEIRPLLWVFLPAPQYYCIATNKSTQN